MRLGNDIVDLAHPETLPGGLSPRFDVRVFTVAERELVSHAGPLGGVSGRVWRWRLWSAKEAAYKAARKLVATAVWSPVKFAVRLTANRVVVDHPTGTCAVRWFDGPATSDGDPAWVHAVCGDAVWTDRIVLDVAPTGQRDPSTGVRELACKRVAAAASAVGIDTSTSTVRTRDRIPEMLLASTTHDLSLSHHGRFAAFACDVRPLAEGVREVAA